MTIGLIAFMGSGETSLAGGRIFETLAQQISDPLRIAIMETPAGFELNSDQVAGRVADFFKTRLQNYHPQVDVIPARKKGTAFSPDDPEITAPLLHANLIFMGPGSPTYAVRQLKDTRAWDMIRARHRMGATLVFASAATIAVGQIGVPVYEIYKVGMDVHTVPGLNFFADFGTPLSFVPHWNNAEGGSDVDTSRCFLGLDRFAIWSAQLPAGHTTIGLDEHTGLILDFEAHECRVMGVSSVSLVRESTPEIFPTGSSFSMSKLGPMTPPEPLDAGIAPDVWQAVYSTPPLEALNNQPPEKVVKLSEQRQAARERKDWGTADELRHKIAALGWTVQDTPDGPKLDKS